MSVAISYASALYQAAREAQSSSSTMDQIEEKLDLFLNTLDHSKEASIALLGPLTTVREKISLLEEISKKLAFPSLLTQFVILLAKKGRLSVLKNIRESFTSVRLAAEGGVAGKLVSAEQMNDGDVQTLAKAFSQKLGKKVAFRVSTDASLLAGMKVTVNGVTYDGTLRSQLQKLRDRFVAGLSGGQA